jgi:hypothetical protein
MKVPSHFYSEPTLDEILSDEIVRAMMAADRVDRHVLATMLAKVAQDLSEGARRQPSNQPIQSNSGSNFGDHAPESLGPRATG